MLNGLKRAVFGGVLAAALLAPAFCSPRNIESLAMQAAPQVNYTVISSSTKDSRDKEQYKTPVAAVGKQAVALIMPESTGPMSTEDWTDATKQKVISAVQQSFQFWQSQTPKPGQLEMVLSEIYVPNIPFEFINTPYSDHPQIFSASMQAIGFRSENDLIEKIRNKENANAAFIVYVANSTNSTHKYFPSGGSSGITQNYSETFPFNTHFVIISASFFNSYAHETGHIEGAQDFYMPGGVPCVFKSGVLNWPSANSAYGGEGCTENVKDIMKTFDALTSQSSKGQTGIIDVNGNGVPDSVDRDPIISIVKNDGPTVVFNVATQGIEPLNPIYPYFNISTVKNLEVIVNGNSTIIQVPARIKSTQIQLNLSGLQIGANTLEIRAETQFGNKTASSKTINYSSIPPPPQLGSPADGSLLSQLGTTLSWVNPADVTQYQLQVIPFNNDGPGINLIRNVETSYAVQAPVFGQGPYVMLPGMTYTWRVRTSRSAIGLSENDSNWGPWSEATFRTPVVTSLGITALSPKEGETVNSLLPVLQWNNDRSDIFYHEVQVSKAPNFGNDAFLYWELRHGGATSPLNSYLIPQQFPLEPKTQYFWRARSRVQGDGIPVSWSPAFSFKTGNF